MNEIERIAKALESIAASLEKIANPAVTFVEAPLRLVPESPFANLVVTDKRPGGMTIVPVR